MKGIPENKLKNRFYQHIKRKILFANYDKFNIIIKTLPEKQQEEYY